jgi:hypothetical protein
MARATTFSVVRPAAGVGVCDFAWELTMNQHPKNDPKNQHPKNDPKTPTQTEKAKIHKDELSEQELDKAAAGLSLSFAKIQQEYRET